MFFFSARREHLKFFPKKKSFFEFKKKIFEMIQRHIITRNRLNVIQRLPILFSFHFPSLATCFMPGDDNKSITAVTWYHTPETKKEKCTQVEQNMRNHQTEEKNES